MAVPGSFFLCVYAEVQSFEVVLQQHQVRNISRKYQVTRYIMGDSLVE
jgi:hypothetical protein